MTWQTIIDYGFAAWYTAETLTLAGKDATSYLLKYKIDNSMSSSRVKRWHRDGVILAILAIIPGLVVGTWYWTLATAILVRLSFFDIGFNHWAGLPETSLGSTAWFDQQFIKIFGYHGAVKKAMLFFTLFIAELIFIDITAKGNSLTDLLKNL